MKVVYTFRARQDLRDIYDYIAFTLLAPDAAKNTTERILEAARGLQSMPEGIRCTRKNHGTAWESVSFR